MLFMSLCLTTRRTAKSIGRPLSIPSGNTKGSGSSFAGATRRSIFKRLEFCESNSGFLFYFIVSSGKDGGDRASADQPF